MANLFSKNPPQYTGQPLEDYAGQVSAYLHYLYETVDFAMGQMQKGMDAVSSSQENMARSMAELMVRVQVLEDAVGALQAGT